jgi:hypothetical protein
MYIGFFTGWASLWIIFGQITNVAITVTAIAVLGVVLFVILYEEPTLRRKFGADYEEYCRNAPGLAANSQKCRLQRLRPHLHPQSTSIYTGFPTKFSPSTED